MDATRSRRTRDRARQQWYARERRRRFARFLGCLSTATEAPQSDRGVKSWTALVASRREPESTAA
jgi:hypothetical protein